MKISKATLMLNVFYFLQCFSVYMFFSAELVCKRDWQTIKTERIKKIVKLNVNSITNVEEWIYHLNIIFLSKWFLFVCILCLCRICIMGICLICSVKKNGRWLKYYVRKSNLWNRWNRLSTVASIVTFFP